MTNADTSSESSNITSSEQTIDNNIWEEVERQTDESESNSTPADLPVNDTDIADD